MSRYNVFFHLSKSKVVEGQFGKRSVFRVKGRHTFLKYHLQRFFFISVSFKNHGEEVRRTLGINVKLYTFPGIFSNDEYRCKLVPSPLNSEVNSSRDLIA